MKKIIYVAIILITWTSCHRNPTELPPVNPVPHPKMQYTDLHNALVKSGTGKVIDLDGNGSSDFSFSTLLLGDPILQRDRLQFYAHSGVKNNLLNNESDESPVLSFNDAVKINHAGYTWFEISAIVLTEKITPLNDSVFWQGRWTNVTHKYLPVQMDKEGKLFHGWIELSFNKAAETLILHRAAICTEPGVEIKAGI